MNFINLITSANEAFKNNKFDQSIKLLKDALKIEPTSIEACLKLGIITLKIGDIHNSLKYFKKTILLDPKSSLAYSNLGLIHSKLNNKELALQNYQKAVEIDPKNFTANYNLANHFFLYNDDINAEKYYLISLKLKPNHFYPYNNLFQLYDRSNKLEKLDKIFHKISNLFGKTASVKFLEGTLEFKKKNYEKTIKIFKNIKVDEKDYQKSILKKNILAKSYDYIGFYSEAFKYYSESNTLLEKFYKKKYDKKNFNDQIKKKLKHLSDNFNNFENKSQIYDNQNDPVFLIGFPRSGTTLLDTILRTHKSIEVIEEELLVQDIMEKLKSHIGDNLSNLNFLNKEIIIKLRGLYFKKRNDLVGLDKNIIYIDKMPLNIIYVAELNKIFPKSKFILALRNPYDAVLSCFMQPFLPNNAMSNFYNLQDASEFYDLVMNLWDKYQQSLNLNLHIIKYEDVVSNFSNSIRKLINFLNLSWEEDLKNFHLTAKKRGLINTPSYNQINMPIYKNSISRWKNYEEKFYDINFKLDKWIKKFGY